MTKRRKYFLLALMVSYSLLTVFPFIWTVSTSFKPLNEVFRSNLIPDEISLRAYSTVISDVQPSFLTLFSNSMLVSSVAVVSHVILACLAGYAFARLEFPGRDIMFYVVLATMMLPNQLRLVPVYQVLVQLGLINDNPTNFLAIFLVNSISAVDIFLVRQYFLNVPKELEEAAKIDGASPLRIFVTIMLPLAMPVVAIISILTFQGTWNDLFWPSVLLQTPNHWTLPFGILQFSGQYSSDWPSIMALVTLSTLPILGLYLIGQRHLINMELASAVK